MTEHSASAPADEVVAGHAPSAPESGEVNGRLILYSAATLVATIALGIGVAYLLYALFEDLEGENPDKSTPTVAGERGPQPNVMEKTRQPPLEQLLRDPPQQSLPYLQPPPEGAGMSGVHQPQGVFSPEDLQGSDASVLDSAGATNPAQAGFRRIPIREAIRLLASDSGLQKQWLPTRPEAMNATPLDQPTQSNSGRGPRPVGRK